MTGEYRFGDTPDTQVIVFIRNPCINSAEPSIAVTTQLYVKRPIPTRHAKGISVLVYIYLSLCRN